MVPPPISVPLPVNSGMPSTIASDKKAYALENTNQSITASLLEDKGGPAPSGGLSVPAASNADDAMARASSKGTVMKMHEASQRSGMMMSQQTSEAGTVMMAMDNGSRMDSDVFLKGVPSGVNSLQQLNSVEEDNQAYRSVVTESNNKIQDDLQFNDSTVQPNNLESSVNSRNNDLRATGQ
jgi:hypothetical protein